MEPKRYLTVREASQHPACPWSEEELRRRIFNARPRYNSRAELVTGTGNKEFLKAFIQEKRKASIYVDIIALEAYLNDHRLVGDVT